jgi:hypothetical protein
MGINLNEAFRREGLLLQMRPTAARRLVEMGKTWTMHAAVSCHAEDPLIWAARKIPGRQALKAGTVTGKPGPRSVSVPNLGGSNPFGGINTGGDDALTTRAAETLSALRYESRPVLRWCIPTEEVIETKRNDARTYPDLLFELEPDFGPTWNLYGPIFSPIITHKRVSGGHRRDAVFACTADVPPPATSTEVNRALRWLCRNI